MENLIKPWQQIFEEEEKLKLFRIKLNQRVQKDLLKNILHLKKIKHQSLEKILEKEVEMIRLSFLIIRDFLFKSEK